MNTYDTIVSIIGDKMDIDPSDISMDSTFESLSIDSLDMVEIVMDLENEFNIEMEDTEDLHTIEDLVNYIDNSQDSDTEAEISIEEDDE